MRQKNPMIGAALAILITTAAASQEPTADLFLDVTASSGIKWVHDNAMSEQHYLPETMGAGGAFLDFDGDGLLDIYLVNSGPSDFYQPPKPHPNALYRNNGDGTFSDVTARAGVPGGTFGMGVAAADYDNDGDSDLFITAYGPTLLYRNRGDGTFEEVAAQAGVRLDGWTSSAVWFDFDNDGLLDLFVCNFVKFAKSLHISCGLNPLGKSYYCVPRVFDPTSSFLFRNQGNGSFARAEVGTAIEKSKGKALGVVAADINGDRRMDLFVANDTVQDFLFINRGHGRWEEAGIFAGVGFSIDGAVQSGMGVDAADFDQDGHADLFVSNIDHQNYSLLRNNGDETFRESGRENGIFQSTFLLSGWGLKFFDYDLDGDLDLLLVNGHPDDMISQYSSRVSYRNPPLLFENRGGRLHDVSGKSGGVFKRASSGRGMALGDFNNDGRQDVLIVNNGQAPILLENKGGRGHHWLGLRLIGKRSNRDAVGAVVHWWVKGKRRTQRLVGGGSYLSSHDPRLVLGLGTATQVERLQIDWPGPDGGSQIVEAPPIDHYLTVLEDTSKEQ